MKINFIVFITASFVLFCGCSKDVKHIKYELEKVGTATVDTVDEITTKSFIDQSGYIEPIWMIKHSINYPNEHNTGDIDNPYRIGFHFKNKNIETIRRGHYSYDLCSEGKKDALDNISDYRGYEPLVDNDGVIHLYFAVETMKKRGFIDSSFKSRGDICLYINATLNLMSKIEKHESNMLIYSTQEINNALEEYKTLQ